MILSRKGWIRARTGHGLDVSQLSFKDGDALLQTLECKTTDPVTVLAASGKSFTVIAAATCRRAAATARTSTRWSTRARDDIAWMGSGDPEQKLLMNSSAGLGFVCKLGDLATKTRQGKDFMKVDEGAQAQQPFRLHDSVGIRRGPVVGFAAAPVRARGTS